GIHSTLLVPLSSGGRALGYLQVANKQDRSDFNDSDVRILKIITGQAAPIIENAGLIRQSIRRALRAESLRRIASLSGSSASLDEILKYSMVELARLFQVDYAAIYLLDETIGVLRVHDESVYGISPQDVATLGRINTNDPEFTKSITKNKTPYLTNNADLEENIISIYQPLIRRLKVKSVIDVPVIIREHGSGEVILASRQPDFFTRSDLQLAMTVASQMAVAIERASLESQTDVDLRRRVEQLTALTRISRELNTSVNLRHLLKQVYKETLQTTRADCGTILLFDQTADAQKREHAPILMYFGEGKPSEKRQPLEIKVIQTADPILIDDFNRISPDEPTENRIPPHAGVRSALIVPIGYQEEVAGLIHLHSGTPNHFDEADLEIIQALAVQAAIAIGNAQRYQDQIYRTELLNRQVETISKIFEVTRNMRLDRPLEETLEDLAYAIQESTPFDVVLFSVYNPQDKMMHRLTGAGIPLKAMEELKSNPQRWENIKKLMLDEFRFGRSYFIPYNQRPDMPEEWHTITISDEAQSGETESDHWHPQDILIIPLLTTDNEPLGLFSVDAPRDGKRPDNTTIETLEIFASQAALFIESQKQITHLRTEVHTTKAQLAQAEEAQTLLPELIEQNRTRQATIEHLKQYLQRISAGLGMVEIANRQPDKSAAFASLGQELRTRLELDLTLVAAATSNGARLLHTFGEIPEKANPEALFGQRNPLRQSLQSGEILFADNLAENEEWGQSPLLHALDAQAFISMPIRSKEAIEAAILGVSHHPLPPFTEADHQFFELLTRQIGSAITNLNLLTETEERLQEVNILLDFSQKLGGLQPVHIL
ncbi:MAG TPA: GAF domain-containing protein, partial [Anaerolineales bacterium]|nr:GAF domain-containing protein [Anaerolineales bacterium]